MCQIADHEGMVLDAIAGHGLGPDRWRRRGCGPGGRWPSSPRMWGAGTARPAGHDSPPNQELVADMQCVGCSGASNGVPSGRLRLGAEAADEVAAGATVAVAVRSTTQRLGNSTDPSDPAKSALMGQSSASGIHPSVRFRDASHPHPELPLQGAG
jgi:hypothetical protein